MTEAAEKLAEAGIEELEKLDTLIPRPVGWAVLVAIPDPGDEYEGGLVKAAETKRVETILSSIGLVLDMGSRAYKDERFGGVPWCEKGDYVMFRPNSGTRFKIDGQEYRLLSDSSIEATVPDPSVISDAR